jgi:hypothetical protein
MTAALCGTASHLKDILMPPANVKLRLGYRGRPSLEASPRWAGVAMFGTAAVPDIASATRGVSNATSALH